MTIAIGARVKRPREQLIGDPTKLKLVDRSYGDEMGSYERLLGDAMDDDSTQFAGQDRVEAARAIVEPVLGNATRRTSTSPVPTGG